MLRDNISVVVSQINRTPFIHSQSARWWMSDYGSVVLSQDRINSITSHEYIVTICGMGRAEIVYNPCTVAYQHLQRLLITGSRLRNHWLSLAKGGGRSLSWRRVFSSGRATGLSLGPYVVASSVQYGHAEPAIWCQYRHYYYTSANENAR